MSTITGLCRSGILSWGVVGATALLLSLLGGARPALAVNDFCDVVTATECQVTSLHNLGAGGTFTVDRVLHIFGATAELRTNAGSTLTLNIAGGSPNGLVMELGGKITGNSTSSATAGATININVAAGNILLATSGATISANNTANSCPGNTALGRGGIINITASGLAAKITTEDGTTISANGIAPDGGGGCPAGAINITAPNQGEINIDGDVLAQNNGEGAGSTGNGGTQKAGGGPIFLIAACNLSISDTGLVSSRGIDPGADLVHLEAGCDITINGKVESTGAGHAVPGNPPNSCNNVTPYAGPPVAVRRNPATRPDKPSNSVGCVEVWAGGSLTINRTTGGLNGEINADTGNGGAQGTSWIDLFSGRGDVRILNTDPNTAAVHANGIAGSNDNGGEVTVKSRDAQVILNGLALQANALGGGGDGGTVEVEAKLNIDLTKIALTQFDGIVQAKGATGDNTNGGHIIMNSFQGNIAAGSAANLNVTGKTPPNGVVDLIACGTIAFPPGTVTPAGATVNKSANTCLGNPTFEPYVRLADCPCNGPQPAPGNCTKASVQAVLNPATGRFPGNLGPDVTVRLDLGQTVQNAVSTAGDTNADGYILVLVVKDASGLLGGNTVENVVIGQAYPNRFGLLACSVTVRAADPNLAAGNITPTASSPVGSPENIFVMDLHGTDSDLAGWLVEGNNRYMRNVNTVGNALGIHFIGNNNTMHNGTAEGNSGVGILVEGTGNQINDAHSFDNDSHGIQIVGNNNVINKASAGDKAKPNLGDGIHVSGSLDDLVAATGNKILESNAFANSGYGIFVVGNSNELKLNDVGERAKGNGLDGVYVKGNSNQLISNDAFDNTGNGFTIVGNTNTLTTNRAGDSGSGNGGDGFNISGIGNTLDGNRSNANDLTGFNFSSAAGTGNKLKNNKSNEGAQGSSKENGGCEYNFAESTSLDQGGNKKNNANFVGTGTPKKYLAGCYEF